MKLVETSIKRPVGVMIIVITAIILGAVALKDLAVDLFPEMDLPVAVVTTSYQGAAPQEVEELVTRPIEEVLSGLDGIDTIQSISQPNSSMVILMFNFGTNIDSALNEIREGIDRVSGNLPDDAGSPRAMRIDPTAQPVMWVSLTGDTTLDRLQLIAENDIQPRFERVDGVASVGLEGGIEREIRVNLNQGSLASYGLSGNQVVQALGAENQAISAGTIIRGNQELQLRIDGEYTSVEDIENTQIELAEGGAVRVRDVATVLDTFKEQTLYSRVNGSDALVFSVMKQSDANTVQVSAGMHDTIDRMQAEMAERGLELQVAVDTADFIRDTIDSVMRNLIIGGILAIAVLLLFFRNVRTTLVLGISMPIAVISTFTLMYFTGQTLNILSMGGLALGIGMMVDSSIVILENIFKKREQGLSMAEAAKEGGSELASAVVASTLTTAVVFLPIVFVEGIAAEMFRPLALTVVFALTAALIVALTIVPMLSSKLLGNVSISFDGNENPGFVDRILNKLRDIYGSFLSKCLNMRKRVIAVVLAAFVGALALIPFVGFEFMPAADDGQVQISVELQTGIDIFETERVSEIIYERVQNEYSDVLDMMLVTIGGSSGFQQVANSHIAEYFVTLIPSTERQMTTQQFINGVDNLISDIPGTEITVTAAGGGMGGGSPIGIEIAGDDLDVLADLSQQVIWILEDIPGTANVDSSVGEGRPEVQVVVDRELAHQYGLSYRQVMDEVRLGFSGQTATYYRENGDEFDVTVSLPEESRTTIRDLETLVIRNNVGMNVPLSAVTELRQIQGPVEINRKDQTRQVNVTSDVRDRDLGSVSQDIQAQLDSVSLPEGYTINMGGETEQMMEAFGQLLLALVLGIFLVYAVMAIQFESFTYPFIIMFSLPTMLIGVVLGLLVTNISLSISAFIGLIMLAGIVVNNGIILVDYINILRRQGIDRVEAIIEAGKSRLRPILMTTLTTALAMVPIAIGLGEGTETQQPMAIVIVFGLFSSTFFTLVLVPVMYLVIDNMNNMVKRLLTRSKKGAGEVEIAEEK
ncbi:efflux RND transporter permease subunit [Bacillus sp. FJAT-45350]|uniref:efflux RND transporter permease subunit n=1 Tax=Bacillus sp. FJAT-45350 TaxID=2011014 RepID=UPI000BB73547|nr:efflux RND transporter permease subunit [Bacillus sp. FJAT-45350]